MADVDSRINGSSSPLQFAVLLVMAGVSSADAAKAVGRTPGWLSQRWAGRGYRWPTRKSRALLSLDGARELGLSPQLLAAVGAIESIHKGTRVWRGRESDAQIAARLRRDLRQRKQFLSEMLRQARNTGGTQAVLRLENLVAEAERRAGVLAPACFELLRS